MNRISRNHILFRFVILLNIVFIIVSAIFFILVNNTVSELKIPSYLRVTLSRINILVFVFSFVVILLNAYLLINHLLFNIKQYFKLASKIDFNDLPTTIGILNNLPGIDEYGDLGKSVTKLLRVYVNYADLMRRRLNYQRNKMKILVNQAQIPVVIFDKDTSAKTYSLSYVSVAAKTFLNLENASSIIGKPLNAFFSKETLSELQNAISQNLKETSSEQLTPALTVEWIKNLDKDSKDDPSILLDVGVIPLVFQFPDDYQYQDTKDTKVSPSNLNTVVDTFLLLFSKTSSIQDKRPMDSKLENPEIIEPKSDPSEQK